MCKRSMLFWRCRTIAIGAAIQVGGTGFSGESASRTPNDGGLLNPYPLDTVRAIRQGVEVASSQAVVPVSGGLNCNPCHQDAGVATEVDILRDHDRLHGTDLEDFRVFQAVASCL